MIGQEEFLVQVGAFLESRLFYLYPKLISVLAKRLLVTQILIARIYFGFPMRYLFFVVSPCSFQLKHTNIFRISRDRDNMRDVIFTPL